MKLYHRLVKVENVWCCEIFFRYKYRDDDKDDKHEEQCVLTSLCGKTKREALSLGLKQKELYSQEPRLLLRALGYYVT